MRKRGLYISLTLMVMVLGLLSRRVEGLPSVIEAYSGDVLWALMVYFGMGWLFKDKAVAWIVICALFFAYGIELSQLYHAPWIDGIRGTTLGGLVLGYGFLMSDLVCYAVGIVIGALIDYGVIKTSKASRF